MGRACPVGTACNRIHILQPDPCAHGPTSCIRKEGVTLLTAPAAGPNPPGVFARCGNVYTFRLQRQASRGYRPTGIGRAGKARRAAQPTVRGTASRRGEGSGMTAEGKAHGAAQRPAPGRGGRPQGRRTFGPVKSSTALLLEKVAKPPMFVYSAAGKRKAHGKTESQS